jgi:hypothetical protein
MDAHFNDPYTNPHNESIYLPTPPNPAHQRLCYSTLIKEKHSTTLTKNDSKRRLGRRHQHRHPRNRLQETPRALPPTHIYTKIDLTRRLGRQQHPHLTQRNDTKYRAAKNAKFRPRLKHPNNNSVSCSERTAPFTLLKGRDNYRSTNYFNSRLPPAHDTPACTSMSPQ